MKKLMVLGGSASEVPLIARSLDMGYVTIVVDQDSASPGLKVDGAIAVHASIADKEFVLNCAREHCIDGILPSVDAGVRTAAYVAKQMGLPGISEETAIAGTDKTVMRKVLKEHGIPIPMFRVVSNKEEYLEALLGGGFGDRCIVKAADSSGSRGIYLVDDLFDKEKIEYAFDYCARFSTTGSVLIEEFMSGPEVCVETLSSKGRCYAVQVTDQLQKNPPYFTDCGYSQPSRLDADVREAAMKIAVEANLALGNDQGSSCTELIITEEGPKIVELGVRLAGDFMTTLMVPLSNGVDMPGLAVKIALGEPVTVEPAFEKASCVRYFMKERVGVIRDIIGLDEARSMPGVAEAEALKAIGDTATLLRKSSDRLAYVVTQGDTVDEAVSRAEEALSRIDFIVEDC